MICVSGVAMTSADIFNAMFGILSSPGDFRLSKPLINSRVSSEVILSMKIEFGVGEFENV